MSEYPRREIFYRQCLNSQRQSNESDIQYSQRMHWREAIHKECGIDPEDVTFVVKRLERTGFISEVTGAFFGYAGGEYVPTESFKRFMEYLSLHPFNKAS
ncbi:hypothetical protein DNHGIG_39720 [Collibacillus ludicampi]|uniref:Uncharacterized protein n=2 Tax=Collibacillus ludicampi TaxID=2771369 RepID=A0AAV4LKW4_9BACL|nr:hypothetical protein DNHGIG_39720 [Collibacillus ludicampi]